MLSDWPLVFATLILAATALLAPYVAERAKRRAFAPKLKVEHSHEPPFSHKTFVREPGGEPVFYFRFGVTNEGQSQARLCEAVLEDMWLYDAAGKPDKLPNFSPVNLCWSFMHDKPFVDINPHRRFFCDIGHVASAAVQRVELQRVDIPGRHDNPLRFRLDVRLSPFAQANCFVPGKYGIKVSLYSENASSQDVYFIITWSGKWQDTEREMFHELVVQRVNSI